jgi:enoyl-CoA hydratase/carnithine racemase
MSGNQAIRYQRHGDIGTLTLARPGKRNAQNPLCGRSWPGAAPS